MGSKINEKLSEILTGIFLSGVTIQILFFAAAYFYRPFWSGRTSFAVGLWIGVAVAAVLSIHMYRSIDHALDMEPDAAESYMRRVYTIRAIVIMVMAAVIWYTGIGYVMASFLGVFCIMFGRWMQPLIHRIVSRGGGL
ncbi:MAG: hypothetical protein LUG93_15025 [Lachnospiraceae bacterium]|nr:hypothetical protein [Lachnospiraceae bacterium]